jgi:proton-dependent oligopeptide transporter, POT family
MPTKTKRTPFPPVFWIANSIEILERFAYYGIYMGFGIYMEHLGYTKGQLGIVQSIFLFISYLMPIISGSFADRFGFKKMFLVSYIAYLPSILMLLFTKSFSGIALTMLCIGFAAGIFKPLVSATMRVVTDKTNKTIGFGIFFAMVNIGATIGPVIAGKLRVISWNYAYLVSAISIGFMFLITIFFYKEPEREIEGETLRKKFKDLAVALSDIKFVIFLVLVGLIFWLPQWAFVNMLAVYVDKSVDTARLYKSVEGLLGSGFANFISYTDNNGIRHLLGETFSNTAYVIILFQLVVSNITKRFKAIPSFMVGLSIAAMGFFFIALACKVNPSFVFLGIFLFAVGEMTASPRIQEYIMWIAPKEKAGLYMGANFLSIGLGGTLSGVTYTSLLGWYSGIGHPEYVWFTLTIHAVVGIGLMYLFTRTLGGFKEMDA